jgi:hypothetical protein
MVYVIDVCRQLSSSSRIRMEMHPDPAAAARKLSTNLYDIYHIRKFVTMHGHMNMKKKVLSFRILYISLLTFVLLSPVTLQSELMYVCS